MKRFYIETWGCQMNDHDSEKFAGTLKGLGYEPTQDPEQADVYLLNTCTIREKAEEKVFSRLGVLKSYKQNKNGEMIIGVAGCVAQQEGNSIFQRAPYVDLVMGTQALKSLPQMIDNIVEKRGRQMDTSNHPDNHLFPVQTIERRSTLKALITIMEGCDNYCTYCIVPFTRGRERSRPAADIVAEARNLADQGFKEIELLGQNVNSYFAETDFAGLLRQVGSVPGIEVVRYVSPHPKDFNRAVIETIRDVPSIATNIHLPAQSGNSWILKRMGREYTREHYLEKVQMIREILPYASLTSDFIVGFPGETDDMFQETLTRLECVGYDRIFSFAYSPRPGTGAIKHGDPVPHEVKQTRLHQLQALQAQIQEQRMQARVGEETWVLIDQVKPEDKYPICGRTRDNALVHLQGEWGQPERYYGQKVAVRIIAAGMHSLRGEMI